MMQLSLDAASHRRLGQYAVGGPFDWIGDAASNTWDAVTTGAVNVVHHVEDGVCDVWRAVLPDWVEDALQVTTKNPWRSIWRGGNFLIASYAPFALMPVTLPLAIMFYPILINLEGIRIAWMVFANCGRVTKVLEDESKDLLDILDVLSPHTDTGRMMRTVVTLAGASGLLDSYDTFTPALRGFLEPVSRGDVPDPGAVMAVGTVAADMAGPDTPYTSLATSSKADLVEMEKRYAEGLEEVGALSRDAVLSASGQKQPARLVLATSPPTKTGTELDKKLNGMLPNRSLVAVGSVAATLAALLYFSTRDKK